MYIYIYTYMFREREVYMSTPAPEGPGACPRGPCCGPLHIRSVSIISIQHGESHDTLQCDKNKKQLKGFKVDSDNPILYMYIYIYIWTYIIRIQLVYHTSWTYIVL